MMNLRSLFSKRMPMPQWCVSSKKLQMEEEDEIDHPGDIFKVSVSWKGHLVLGVTFSLGGRNSVWWSHLPLLTVGFYGLNYFLLFSYSLLLISPHLPSSLHPPLSPYFHFSGIKPRPRVSQINILWPSLTPSLRMSYILHDSIIKLFQNVRNFPDVQLLVSKSQAWKAPDTLYSTLSSEHIVTSTCRQTHMLSIQKE